MNIGNLKTRVFEKILNKARELSLPNSTTEKFLSDYYKAEYTISNASKIRQLEDLENKIDLITPTMKSYKTAHQTIRRERNDNTNYQDLEEQIEQQLQIQSDSDIDYEDDSNYERYAQQEDEMADSYSPELLTKILIINPPFNPDKCLEEINNFPISLEINHRIKKIDKEERKDYQHIKTLYYQINSLKQIKTIIKDLYSLQTNQFKINLNFGCVYEQKIDKEDRISWYEYIVFRPSNRDFLFERPKFIKDKTTLKEVLKEISFENLEGYLHHQTPASLRSIGLYTMGVKIYSLQHPIGTKITIPEYISKNKNIVNPPSTNNMCLWNCIAYHETKNKRCATEGKQIFTKVMGQEPPKEYAGIDLLNDDITIVELTLQKGISVYELEEIEDEEIQRSVYKDKGRSEILKTSKTPIKTHKLHCVRPPSIDVEENINILHFEGHAMYISRLDVFNGVKYQCETCGNCFDRARDLTRHLPTCVDFKKKDVFVERPIIYEPRRNYIKELNEEYETNCDFRYEPIIVFDFESICCPKTKDKGENLKINNLQRAVSVSLFSNVEGYNENEIFIEHREVNKLFRLMFEKLQDITDIAVEKMNNQYQPLLDILNDELTKYEEKSDKHNAIKTKIINLRRYINEVPILGFNSGFYDINVNISEFMSEIHKRSIDTKGIISIKQGNSFKSLRIGQFYFLDICQYVGAGTSLDQYIKAFNKSGLRKFIFPYEFLDSYDKLDYDIHQLKKEDFYSSLKNKHIEEEEWVNFQLVKEQNGWKTLRDLLKYYNNLDVRPFLQAVLNQRNEFYKLGVDMFKDGMSLPSLAEKVMFSFEFQEFNNHFIHQRIPPKQNFSYPSTETINDKLYFYEQQDKNTKRYDKANFIQETEVMDLFNQQSACCHYCWNRMTICDNEEFLGVVLPTARLWSLDRINNDYGHNKGNCVLACVECNRSRSDMKYHKFYRQQALLRYAKDHDLIYLIDEDNKKVFYELKNNICGGPSIVFHRYHEADKTKIQRPVYNQETKEWGIGEEGKLVKNITGFDANALYLWCIGNEMPCGKLRWVYMDMTNTEDINNFVNDENTFGFIKVDIHTPEDKFNHFGEFPLIFKNIEYDANEIMGDYMKNVYDKVDGKQKLKRMTRKLISSFKGDGLLIKSTRLKWLLNQGLVITKIHGYIPAKRGRPFKAFMEKVCEERRKGDIDPDHAIIADMWKLVGNSAFGRTGMDKSKHNDVKYGDKYDYLKVVNSILFKDANQYMDLYEISKDKREVKQNIPIQVACSIYDDAKLLMSQFYYDCLDKFVDRKDFQMVEMDTDSNYMALTDDFENLIKPEMRETFEMEKNNWFPRTDTKENKAFDKRTAGLFKIEFKGAGIVALAPKMYYVKGFDEKDKYSSKGIQKNNNLDVVNYENYKTIVLGEKDRVNVVNKGLRIFSSNQLYNVKADTQQGRGIYMYSQMKLGLSAKYDKRYVLKDGISTVALNI